MAPRQAAAQPQYLDEHHQRISEFAAEYFDDDEEREVFVGTLLERRGYQRNEQRIVEWLPPEPAAGGQGGGDPAAAGPGKPRPPAYFKR